MGGYFSPSVFSFLSLFFFSRKSLTGGGVGFFFPSPPFFGGGFQKIHLSFPSPPKVFFFILRLCGNVDISGRQIEWNCLCFSSSLSRLLCAKVRIAIPGCRDRGAGTALVCLVWGFLHRSGCGKGEGVLSPHRFPCRLLLLFPSSCRSWGRRDAHT